jgi:tetratricopeptide (TPR) repeat protein
MKNIAGIFIFLAFILPPSLNAQTLQKIDSLEKILETKKEDTSLVKLLDNISWEYRGIQAYEKAIYHANQALLIAAKLMKGEKGKIKFALSRGMANAYNNLGVIYNDKSDYTTSLSYHHKALKLREEIGDRQGQAGSYNNIGNIYWSIGNYEKALEMHRQSLKLSEELKEKAGIANSYNNIGLIYWNNGQAAPTIEAAQNCYKMALKNYFNSLEIMLALKNKTGVANAYENIGVVYGRQAALSSTKEIADNLYERALENHLSCLKLREEGGDQKGIAISYQNIGDIYFKQNKLTNANTYFNRALLLFNKIEDMVGIKQISFSLSELYEKKHNPANALKFHKMYVAYKDTLLNEANIKQVNEIQTRYETEKKEKQIGTLTQKTEILAQQNEIQQLQLSQNRYFILGLSGISLLILAIAFLLISQNRLRARQSKIELEQKLLVSQTKALHAQMNPHFIFNCMASIQSFMTQNDAISSAKYLAKFARLIRATLENSQQPFVSLESEIKMLEDYMELESLRFANKFTYAISVSEKIDPEITEIPSMLIQPHIENAIIHGISPKKTNDGRVTIGFKVQDNTLHCTITDNGIGRKKAREIKAAMELTHRSLGMSITEERLELINTKENIRVHSKVTDLEDENKISRGTTVEITIPLTHSKIQA